MRTTCRWQFEPLDLRSHHISLELESKVREALMHLLEPGKILSADSKTVTEQALDITLTVQFRVATTETKW